MYLSFYKLKHKPFQISTDPRFLWLGEKHEEALSTLKYGVLDNKGFLLLTGDVGTGKTTLINALLNSLDKNTFVASIRDPALNPMEFFQYTAHAFGMKASTINTKIAFLIQFEEFLLEAYKNKRKVLLIIDEAQRMSQELLEEVRLLSNIEKEESKLINIFFVGQLEFNDILLQYENRAIRQRVTISYNIETLTEKETRKYIKHRLNIASSEQVVSSFTPLERKENGEYVRQGYTLPLTDTREEIFTPKAIHEIYNFSKGYPRLINIICDRALLTGYVEGSRTVTDAHVRECIKELEIPHAPEKEHVRKISQEAAVARINTIKPDRSGTSDQQKVTAPPAEPPPGEENNRNQAASQSSTEDRTTEELLSELEKLVKKTGILSASPQQQHSEEQGDTEKVSAEKKPEFSEYRKLAYFIGIAVFCILLYFTFTPRANNNSPEPQPEQSLQKTMPLQQVEPVKGMADSDEPSATTTQQNNEPSVSSAPGESETLPQSIALLNDKEPIPVLNISENGQDIPVATEEVDINTRIKQLRELITFQKLRISFQPGSTIPEPGSRREVDRLIAALHSHPSFNVTVGYYSAEKSTESWPAKRLERQVDSIMKYLLDQGVQPERITLKKQNQQDLSPFADEAATTNIPDWVELYVDR